MPTPFTSNRDLAAAVGGAIATRTVSDYLACADPPFTAKVAQDQEPEELSEDWKAAARTWLAQVRRIAMSRRVYADETGIYANEALKRGRSRKGNTHLSRSSTSGEQVHAARFRDEDGCGVLGVV